MAQCDTNALLTAWFESLTPFQKEVAITQLLCEIKTAFETGVPPMATCDPNALMNPAYAALTVPQLKTIQAQLLCDIMGTLSGGGSGSFIPRIGADTATSTLGYAASLSIDFDGPAQQKLTLGGNITLSTANRGDGKFVSLRLFNPGPPRTISLAAGIRPIIGTFPATLLTNKAAWLTFVSNGPNETDTDAGYQDQP